MKPVMYGLRAATVPLGVAALAALGAAASPTVASASEAVTTVGQHCMQKVFGTPVTNANRLNCTANDIRLSRAVSASPSSCVRGTRFDLTATFETVVTANARYDAGFFFRTDGGPDARGAGSTAAGQCSLSGLKMPPAFNLDGDTSGDLNSGTYYFNMTIPGVLCDDPDNDGKLNLPNCTSWHSNQGTVSDINDPFTFNPDTKSKCACDDSFEVPVNVETASLKVTKSPNPTSIYEPGGTITFTVTIENISQVESVRITSLSDDVFGNLASAQNGLVSDNSCVAMVAAQPVLPVYDANNPTANQVSCSFKGDVWGQPGDIHENEVTAGGIQVSNNAPISGKDKAQVAITNRVGDAPTLSKQAQSTQNCTLEASYQVVVNNNSRYDQLRLTALTDNMFGNITTVQGDVTATDCATGGWIDTNDNYTCAFTAKIESASCSFTHENTITAAAIDDDGETYSNITGKATVIVVTSP